MSKPTPSKSSSSKNCLEAVFFDLDGTLLDTALDFETAINRVLCDEGREEIPTEKIRQYVTHGSKGIIEAAFSIDSSNQDFLRLQTKLLNEYKKELINKTIIFKGLENTFNILNNNEIVWGVVTNKPLEYAQPIMDALLPESSVLICPDHVKQTKPHPEGLFLACEQQSVTPENCIYVGDHIRDIQAGKAAGMITIGVEWGYIDIEKDNPKNWGANHVAVKPSDLAPLIDQYISK